MQNGLIVHACSSACLQYHRVAGVLAWVFVTLHMLVWFVKWLIEGTLGNNMVATDRLIIAAPRNV